MSEKTFNKKAVIRWRRAVFREVHQLGFLPGHRGFSALMVMAAIYGFGTDVAVLCEMTGYQDDFVKAVLKRLRKARILAGQTLRVRWNADGIEGHVALACDGLVAAGDVDRPADPKRSAAQRARTDGRGKGTPKRRSAAPIGPYTPKIVKADPLYQIAGKQETPTDGNG